MPLRQQAHKAVQWFHETTKDAIWIPQAIAIPMLFFAVIVYDSSYYILLRWICCPVFAYLAFQAFSQQKQNWVWILGVTALVFNPLNPHLPRRWDLGVWSLIDVAAIVIATTSIFILKAPKT